MAYNDYGAFVYLNGVRQPDYEDVPLFGDKDTDLGPGMRIYASLIRQYGDMSEGKATPFQWPSRCHHGTMGDGKVRVGVYKTGISAASIYVLSDDVVIGDDTVLYQREEEDGTKPHGSPFAVAIEGGEEIVRLSGEDFVPFPRGYDGSEEHQAQADENNRQLYGPYHYELEVAGHRILFEAREYDAVIRPSYHARMTCPDGDVWDIFYDSNYGAGLSDYRIGLGRDERYDTIDVERVGSGDMLAWPLTRRLPVSYLSKQSRSGIVTEQEISVTSEALDRLAESFGLVVGHDDGDDDAKSASREHILYRAMRDESCERSPVSTFSGWRDSNYIDAEAVIKLVQLGIDLAHMGIDSIERDHRWSRPEKDECAYGLDGTPFERVAYGLDADQMVPGEVRYDREHPLHDDERPAQEVIEAVFDAYREECEKADWTCVIDENDLGVELTWPIRDSKGYPFSPLMQPDGDGVSWQIARRVSDNGELCEIVGCGWNDERPFVLLSDGEMANPSDFVLVPPSDTDE